MKCPVCNVDLLMSERGGIEIDYCPKCRGVWLDRGELDKIIERSIQEMKDDWNEKYPDQRSYPDKDYYKHKKRKSWLGDIFDF